MVTRSSRQRATSSRSAPTWLLGMTLVAAVALGGCGRSPTPQTGSPDSRGDQPLQFIRTDTEGDAPPAARLDAGPLDGPSCTKPSECKAHPATPWCLLAEHVCVACMVDFQCQQHDPNTVCLQHRCLSEPCSPGASWCKGDFVATCAASGAGYTVEPCGGATPTCSGGACRVCVAKSLFCALPTPPNEVSKQAMRCSADGMSAQPEATCSGGQRCIEGACRVCSPGQRSCKAGVAYVCDPVGLKLSPVQDCAQTKQLCLAGMCVDPCATDVKSNTHAGCRYWAVDLDNAIHKSGGQTFDAQNMQFAAIVSNTAGIQTKFTATVTVRTGKFSAVYQVPAGHLKTLRLPDPAWSLSPQNLDGTTLNHRSFEITSDVPIIAYQFNPLENFGVFSNDASLLLPAHVLGAHYLVLTRRQNFAGHPGYVTVVGAGVAQAGQPAQVVTVTIRPTALTRAGKDIPQHKAGETFTVKLTPGQVLNLESGVVGADLTGTTIDADGPVAVFAGSEAANVPDSNDCIKKPGAAAGTCAANGWPCTSIANCPITCCADHIEQQLFPIQSWGTTYVATKLQPRGKEADSWRIVAATDGTTVKTMPSQGGPWTLNAGQWIEFESTQDFVITASHPIEVGHFMASANAPNPNNDVCTKKQLGQSVCATWLAKTGKTIVCGQHADCPNIPEKTDARTGDPAFILTVAEAHWLPRHVFLTPDKYKHSYINLIRRDGTSVTLDGVAVSESQFVKVPGSVYTVARIAVKPGGHVVKATAPVGVLVYGWDQFVSYGYPAGASF